MSSGLSQVIYARAPIWVQNWMVSLKGVDFRYRRCDHRVMQQEFRRLRETERYSPEEFAMLQAEGLRATLAWAFSTVPYYQQLQKDLGCDAQDFSTLEDYRRFPMLAKTDLRGNERRFVSLGMPRNRVRPAFTSGTTGTPLHLAETAETFAKRWAFVARLRSWIGLSDPFYPRRAQFTGRDIVPAGQRSPVYWRRNRPGNALLFSTTHINHDTAPHYARALREFAPELIDGYPSALLVLSRLAGHQGIELPRPKGIIVSAETLLEEHRRELEAAFGCRVFNQYAASEPSCLWCDCEYGTMHENPEYGISEVVDEFGEPVGEGQAGEVVVTSFLNNAMPLLRYRLGDVAVRGPAARCRCGRAMPRIDRVIGRRDDVLYIPGRGYIGRLDPVFKGLDHIVEAQIIQESLDQISVLAVVAGQSPRAIEEKLRSKLAAKLGNDITISIRWVDRIPRGPNGKFRAVVSKIKHEYPSAAAGR